MPSQKFWTLRSLKVSNVDYKQNCVKSPILVLPLNSHSISKASDSCNQTRATMPLNPWRIQYYREAPTLGCAEGTVQEPATELPKPGAEVTVLHKWHHEGQPGFLQA